jgi:hypothetical protein
VLPYRRQWALWTETWIDPYERLRQLEQAIVATGVTVRRGNAYEPWDLDIAGGLLGSARILMAVEEHGSGTQYVRLATWPRYSKLGLILPGAGAITAVSSAMNGQLTVATILAAGSLLLLGAVAVEAGRSLATVLAIRQRQESLVFDQRSVIFEARPSNPMVAPLQSASVQRSVPDA